MTTTLKNEIRKAVDQIKAAFECAICLEMLVHPSYDQVWPCFLSFLHKMASVKQCLLLSLDKKLQTTACPLCKKAVSKRSIQELTLWEEIVSTVHQLSSAHEEEAQLCDDVSSVAASRNQVDSGSSAASVPAPQKESSRNCRLRNSSSSSAAHNSSNRSLDDVCREGKVVREADEFKHPNKIAVEPLTGSVRYPLDEQENVLSVGVSRAGKIGGIGSSRPLTAKHNQMASDTDSAVVIPVRDSTLDPYEFVASQHTPKVCQGRGKRHRRSLEYSMFDDPEERANSLLNTGVAAKNSRPAMIKAKRKWKSDGAETSKICADTVLDEIYDGTSESADIEEQQRIAKTLSDAENYDLVFSQSLQSKSGAKTNFSKVADVIERTRMSSHNNNSNRENSSLRVSTASVMSDSTSMEDTEYYEFESVNDHNFGNIEQRTIVASDTNIGSQAKTSYDDLQGTGSQFGLARGKRLLMDGFESTASDSTFDKADIVIEYPASKIDGKISPKSWISADLDSSGDSTDSMELQTQMLEFESPKSEFKKPTICDLAIRGTSASVKSTIVKHLQRRKTFSIGGSSQCDEPAALPTDSLDMYNIIGEVAEIFQRTDDRQTGPSCTTDEDLSTQEIDAHLSREYATTSRSDTPVEGSGATENRNTLPDSDKVKSFQVLSTKVVGSKAIHDNSDVVESQLRVTKSHDQGGIRFSGKPAAPLKMKISLQGNNSVCLIPSIGIEHSDAVSSLSGQSCSILEQPYKLYEPSEVVSLNSESVSQCLSTQDIGQQMTRDSERIDCVEKGMRLIGNSGPAGKPTRKEMSTKSANLTRDSQQIECVTKKTQPVVVDEREGEQTVKDMDSESTNSISDEMLLQVWLPKTGVHASQLLVTPHQSSNGIPTLAELDSKQACTEDEASFSESEESYGITVSRRTTLTPSSNLSSQSELLTTQQQRNLEKEVNSIEREIALLSAQIVIGSGPENVVGNSAKVCLPSVVEDEESVESETDSDFEDPSRTADTVKLLEEEEIPADTVKLFEEEEIPADTVKLLEEEEIPADTVKLPEEKQLIDASSVEHIWPWNNNAGGSKAVEDINMQQRATLEINSSAIEPQNLLQVHGGGSAQSNPQTCEEDTVNEIPDSLDALKKVTYHSTVIEDGCSSDSDGDLFVSPTQDDSCPAVGKSLFVKVIAGANSADDGDVDEAVDLQDTSILYPSREAKRSERSSCVPEGIARSDACVAVKPKESRERCLTVDVAFKRKETQELETVTISSNESMPASDQTTQPGTAATPVNRLSNSPEFSSGCVRKTPSTSSFPKRSHWTFVVSGISRDTDQPFVDALVKKLGCKLMPKFAYGTTHVLVKAVSEGGRRCHRTLKFFQGVAHKAWVLNVDWARDSIKENKLLPAEKYEILGDAAIDDDHCGPTKARLSSKPLLLYYEVCCYGKFDGLTPDDLRDLLKASGASNIFNPVMFSYEISLTQVIIVDSLPVGPAESHHYSQISRRYRSPVVTKDWLLDTIGTFDIKSIDSYLATPWLSRSSY